MINYSHYDIDTKTDDGMLLLAALAILTSINKDHLESGRFGSKSSPPNVLQEIVDLANKMYYPDEYINYKRNKDIDKIVD